MNSANKNSILFWTNEAKTVIKLLNDKIKVSKKCLDRLLMIKVEKKYLDSLNRLINEKWIEYIGDVINIVLEECISDTSTF